jgi:hypothetical protein
MTVVAKVEQQSGGVPCPPITVTEALADLIYTEALDRLCEQLEELAIAAETARDMRGDLDPAAVRACATAAATSAAVMMNMESHR